MIRLVRLSRMAMLPLLCMTLKSAEPESGWEIGEWERFYGLDGGLFADRDGDGIANFIEFGFGLNPLERQVGEEFSPNLDIAVDENGVVTLGLWQPKLTLPLLGEGAYGRQWFSFDILSTADGERWDYLASKVGVGDLFGIEGVEIQVIDHDDQRVRVLITDKRPGLAERARIYRMFFYLVS